MVYLTVRDLNREQLNVLKAAYFDDPDFEEINEGTYKTPEEIPDEIIFEHWEGVRMEADDFDAPQVRESPRVHVTVHLSDGDTISTWINCTAEEALKYYTVGRIINNGTVSDHMVSIVSVEIDG